MKARVLGLSAIVLVVGCGDSSQAGSPGAAGSLGSDAGSDAAAAGGAGATASGGSAGQGGTGAVSSGGAGAAGTGAVGTGGVAGSGGAAGGAGAGNAGSAGAGGSAGASGSSGSAGMSSGGSGPSAYCGDDIKNQASESCDGNDHAGASCASLLGANWGGSLSCSAGCAFDTSGCQCAPDCSGGKNCGSDGCSGSCGTCGSGSCDGGHCSCTPNCAGKQCGSDGCSGSCGSCGGGTTCSAGQCKPPGGCAPATTCPTQTPQSSDAQYCLGMGTYNQCLYCPANCGAPQFGYHCEGSGGPPGVSGCVNTGGGAWCCPTAACMRATPWDSRCVSQSLPPVSYTCHDSASVPSGCVQHSPGYYCCPS